MKLSSFLVFFTGLYCIFCPMDVPAQVVETAKGKVEFIGLESWTPQKLLDALAVIAPDKPFAACAADLKHKLGFADAAVIVFLADKDDKEGYTLITVVESQHANRVRYKPVPADTLEDMRDWGEGIEIFEKHPHEFQYGLIHYGYHLKNLSESAYANLKAWGADSVQVERFWNFLRKHRTELDRELAIWTLMNDGNYKNRIIGSVILANFSESDLTWWLLMDGLRDTSGRVRTTASQVLQTLSKHIPKDVNWIPIAVPIRYILDGTNPFVFQYVVEVLLETNVSKNICEPLLKGAGHLLLAYLKTQKEEIKGIVHQLLVKLSGRDYGYNYSQWENWINGL